MQHAFHVTAYIRWLHKTNPTLLVDRLLARFPVINAYLRASENG